MTDIVSKVGVEFTANGAQAVERSLDEVAAAGTKTEAALKGATAAEQALAAEARRAATATVEVANAAAGASNKLTVEAQAIRAVDVAQRSAAKAAGLHGNELANLSFQLNDVITGLASGQKPLQILAQQGGQVAQVFQVAAGRGVTLSAAIGGIVSALAPFAPLVAVIAAAGGAFLLYKKYADDAKAATEGVAKAVKGLADTQAEATSALGKAAEFAVKYKAANTGVAEALDRVLLAQDANYAATLKGVDITNTAAHAAAQRAEQEKLLTVALLRKAAAEAQSRAAEADKDAAAAKKAAFNKGLLTAFQFGEDPNAIALGQKAQADAYAKTGVQAEKAGAAERGLAKELLAVADATGKAVAQADLHTKKLREHKSEAEKAADALKKLREHTAEYIRSLEDELAKIGLVGEETKRVTAAREAEAAFKRGDVDSAIRIHDLELEIEALADLDKGLKEATASVKALDKAQVEFEKTPAKLAADLEKMTASLHDSTAQAKLMADAFDAVANSFDGLIRGIKTGNLGRVALEFQQLRGSLGAAFAAGPLNGVGAIANAASPYIGGTSGKVLSGIGAATGLYGLGSAAGGAILGASGGVALGGLAGGLQALAPALGPIGFAIGAGLALASLLKGKPSNAGAGFDLNTGQLSGKSRTAETEQAATGAGKAILAGEKGLRDAGANLTTVINGLVIGTRDQTQIYLSTGETLRTAVGDTGAAAEAALKAVLQGATFTNEAEKKLVDSMVAAGDGFDDILAAIQNFNTQNAAAQAISGNLSDAILQLTDPKAFDLKSVHDAIANQRKAAEDAATAGYLTADQLSTINAQLTTLEGLQVDAVMKRYTDAIDTATDAARKQAQGLSGSISDQILQIVDPKAFDLKQVHDGIAEQRQAAEDAAAAGYITADVLATINTQLSTLEGLQIDQVLKRYAVAISDGVNDNSARIAIDDATKTANDAQRAVDTARGVLQEAYNAAASDLNARIDGLGNVVSSLTDYASQLTAQIGRTVTAQRDYAKAQFEAVRAAYQANPSDPAAYAKLQSAGEAFLTASKSSARNALEFARDQAEVRRAVVDAKDTASQQLDVAKQQLSALNASVAGLLNINNSVQSVTAAIGGLQGAIAAALTASQNRDALTTPAPANDVIDVAQYIRDNPDLAANFNAGGILSTLGPTLADAALEHYRKQGRFEIAAGTRKFATGGSFTVSGPGSGDRVPVGFWANGGEQVSVSRSDNMERVAKALERQNALLEKLAATGDRTGRLTEAQLNLLRRVTRDGDSLLTEAA